MLADLTLILKPEKDAVDYHQSSNLQGVLMEHVDLDYASYLHQQGLNPYSQAVTAINEWHVRTTIEESYKRIILPLMRDRFDSFLIKKDQKIDIQEKKLTTVKRRSLMDEFCDIPCGKKYTIQFQTPASFKVRGRYWNMPDIRLILQSLMKKYSADGNEEFADETVLEQLIEAYEPNRYSLRSTVFPIEGIVIPSFMGSLSFRMAGSETMARYVRLLLHFGEFSGLGIKSAMGMGSIRWQGDEKGDRSHHIL